MIIFPAITLLVGLGLVVVFEVGHAYMEKRWRTPLDKQEWFLVYWGLIIAGLICCKLMPLAPPGILYWAPFDVVVFFHIFIICSGGSFFKRLNHPSSNPPGSPSSNQPNAPHDPNIHNLRKKK